MSRNELTSLPVVNDYGAVIASISASDLRNTHRSTIKHVLRPILEFISYAHGGNVPAPIQMSKDTPLLQAMKVLLFSSSFNEGFRL